MTALYIFTSILFAVYFILNSNKLYCLKNIIDTVIILSLYHFSSLVEHNK